MHKHPYFDLWLHDDDELAAILGGPVTQRVTIHEWPLSCVQRLHAAAGATAIYKAQAPPTVEPTFYQRARSPLVVAAQVLPCDDLPAALLLEDVQAPRLIDLSLAESTRLAIVEHVITQIGLISGDLPTLIDIRTPSQWLAYGQTITENLHALVEAGAFQQVNQAIIDRLAAHVQSSAVLAAIDDRTGYVHADLRGENVLVLTDGYRVLDWQRPIWGPIALDRATLLESMGIDPTPHVPIGVLQLRALLLIGWFSQAARRWFPAGAPTYDTQISQLARQLEVR